MADLLDTIYQVIGCSYLSDLHTGFYDCEIKKTVKMLAADAYPLEEWKEAVSYITRNSYECKDKRDAQRLLGGNWKRERAEREVC